VLRGSLALLLLLIGAGLTFPASVALWEQRVLMDEQRFIALGDEVLAEEPVQRLLTERIADEAVAIEPRLPPEAARLLAQRIVRQLPKSDISADALSRSHEVLRRLVREEGVRPEEDAIILDLSSVVARVIDERGLGSLTPQRAIVPPDTGRFVIVQREDVTQAFGAARWFDSAATYIVLAPLAAFALALIVAHNRPLTLFGAGVLVALAAAARIALLQGSFETRLVDAALLDASARPAALAVYDQLAGSFMQQDVLVLAGGVAATAVGLVLTVLRLLVKSGS
jgi:hypothetical protein